MAKEPKKTEETEIENHELSFSKESTPREAFVQSLVDNEISSELANQIADKYSDNLDNIEAVILTASDPTAKAKSLLVTDTFDEDVSIGNKTKKNPGLSESITLQGKIVGFAAQKSNNAKGVNAHDRKRGSVVGDRYVEADINWDNTRYAIMLTDVSGIPYKVTGTFIQLSRAVNGIVEAGFIFRRSLEGVAALAERLVNKFALIEANYFRSRNEFGLITYEVPDASGATPTTTSFDRDYYSLQSLLIESGEGDISRRYEKYGDSALELRKAAEMKRLETQSLIEIMKAASASGQSVDMAAFIKSATLR